MSRQAYKTAEYRKKQIIDYIRRYKHTHAHYPRHREISEHVGITVSHVNKLVDSLIDDGFIKICSICKKNQHWLQMTGMRGSARSVKKD